VEIFHFPLHVENFNRREFDIQKRPSSREGCDVIR